MNREQHIQTWRERSLKTGRLDSIDWKTWRDTVLLYKPKAHERRERDRDEYRQEAA